MEIIPKCPKCDIELNSIHYSLYIIAPLVCQNKKCEWYDKSIDDIEESLDKDEDCKKLKELEI